MHAELKLLLSELAWGCAQDAAACMLAGCIQFSLYAEKSNQLLSAACKQQVRLGYCVQAIPHPTTQCKIILHDAMHA